MAEGFGVAGLTREIDERRTEQVPLLRDHVGTVQGRDRRATNRLSSTDLVFGDTLFLDANGLFSVNESNMTLGNIGGTLAVSKGGTGQTAKTAAFDALAPATTKGDVIVYNGSDNIRLAIGTNTHVLTADSGEASGVKWTATSGGDVTGPGSATDEAIVRFDGTGGKTLQNSGATVTDAGKLVSAIVEADSLMSVVGIGGIISVLNGHFATREVTSTPSSPPTSNGVNIYTKADKIIFQYNDGGTVRYKYLDMTGTGVTWQHSTSAP